MSSYWRTLDFIIYFNDRLPLIVNIDGAGYEYSNDKWFKDIDKYAPGYGDQITVIYNGTNWYRDAYDIYESYDDVNHSYRHRLERTSHSKNVHNLIYKDYKHNMFKGFETYNNILNENVVKIEYKWYDKFNKPN